MNTLFMDRLPIIPEISPDRGPLTMLHFADLHSHYEKYPNFLPLIRRIVEEESKERPVLLVFNGDLFEGGDVVAERSQGVLDWEFMRELRQLAPVLVNLGNHEFDFMSPGAYLAKAKECGLSVIGTLAWKDSGVALSPSMVQAGGLALMGLSVADMNTYPTAIEKELVVPSPEKCLRQMLGEIQETELCPFLISHAGLDADARLLQYLPSGTQVFGAHNHLLFEVPLSGGGSYRHQGFRGEAITVTRVDWSDGQPSYEFRDLAEDPNPPHVDAGWEEKVFALQKRWLNSDDTEIIGTNPRGVSYRRAAQWVADQLRASLGVDATAINHTSIGSELPEGAISRYCFNAFVRFENELVSFRLSGEDLVRIREKATREQENPLACGRGDLLFGAFPEEIDPGQWYTLVTTDWIASEPNQLQYLGLSGRKATGMKDCLKAIIKRALCLKEDD
ncbi:MAG: metallophosphoesterase [Opitutales bacterium]|nr:metallophosphoesterase [Opitutales bacterium]MCH8539170.1 metallophosphoesterase [Opitutales bacterium]